MRNLSYSTPISSQSLRLSSILGAILSKRNLRENAAQSPYGCYHPLVSDARLSHSRSLVLLGSSSASHWGSEALLHPSCWRISSLEVVAWPCLLSPCSTCRTSLLLLMLRLTFLDCRWVALPPEKLFADLFALHHQTTDFYRRYRSSSLQKKFLRYPFEAWCWLPGARELSLQKHYYSFLSLM